MHAKQQHRNQTLLGGLLMGTLIVLVGVVLLLVQLDYLAAADARLYWPSALILVGLAKIFQRGSGAPLRVFGGLVVSAGVLLQLHTLGHVQLDLHRLWPALIIVGGLWIAWMSVYHRRATLAQNTVTGLDEFVLFGGRESRVRTTDFEGGRAVALFGGCEIDLTKAEMKGSEATIDAHAMFGGVDIRVPEHWTVILKGTPIFGGFEDKTTAYSSQAHPDEKRLIVMGHALCGAVEIKN